MRFQVAAGIPITHSARRLNPPTLLNHDPILQVVRPRGHRPVAKIIEGWSNLDTPFVFGVGRLIALAHAVDPAIV